MFQHIARFYDSTVEFNHMIEQFLDEKTIYTECRYLYCLTTF